MQQSNFNNYRMLRIDEAPQIDVHVIKSNEHPGGIGETGATGRSSRLAQRDLCRNRRAAPPSPHRPRRTRSQKGLSVMRTRAASVIIAAAILVALGVYAWHVFFPGPMAFAGGSTVALADYHEANPTGVPAGLAKAGIVERGEYLTKAADCMVCHTAPGGAAFAGGLAFPLPFGTLYRPISPPTGTLASATTAIRTSSTRCSAASARTARGFIPLCHTHHTPS